MSLELIDLIFSKSGVLSRTLDSYEERVGQKEMASLILTSYEKEEIALIEAGTGIGKSLAYLFPALFWALKHQEKTVISTHTIALQEQLLHKDIPFLLEMMEEEVKVCLVKGMNNYVCLRKLEELQLQPLLFSTEESDELFKIEKWAAKTNDGSKSNFPLTIHPAIWEKVAADLESCNHIHCPHYRRCFFFKARKEAEEAQLLIVNHHLLLADLQRKHSSQGTQSILPRFERLIIDEAHHLESIALESFAQRMDRISLLRQLAKLHSDQHPERSRLTLLKNKLASSSLLSSSLQQKLEIDLPAQKRACQLVLDQELQEIVHFFEECALEEKDVKKRIDPALVNHPFWQEKWIRGFKKLREELLRLIVGIEGLTADLEMDKSTSIYEKLSIDLIEIQAIARRLEAVASFLEVFIKEEALDKRVRWVEMKGPNPIFFDARLDVSEYFENHLFAELRTTVLCSATLTTSSSFLFLKQRLGLLSYEARLKEAIYDSPFNYKERTLFAVPTDLPEPSHPHFLKDSALCIEKVIKMSKGSAFLLFTSYDMLEKMYELLCQTPIKEQFPFLKQGDYSRHLLLEKFKQQPGSVLFATDSFWEGVDVKGEALRCVIIVKLPFSVPNDPLYAAYAEKLEKEGLHPFFDYAVPQAVIKFKQGFGRLMRSKQDCGSVICLDHRIVKKPYGKQFLNSLPSTRIAFSSKEDVYKEMRAFYSDKSLMISSSEVCLKSK